MVDWKAVWKELIERSDLPTQAPWNPKLQQALESDPLLGNLRDLQRLAYWLMAYSEEGSLKRKYQKE